MGATATTRKATTRSLNVENGVLVACECPADTYRDVACKHRVAVVIQKPVLEAATEDGSRDHVATDGGELIVAGDEGEALEDDVGEESDDDCACSMLPGDYPCTACYISGMKSWPDEETDDHGRR